jgi:hypothetical protein
VADGVGLHEHAQLCVVGAVLVIIHPGVFEPDLAGALEQAGVARAGIAVGVIGVGLGARACIVGVGDNGAALIGMEP